MLELVCIIYVYDLESISHSWTQFRQKHSVPNPLITDSPQWSSPLVTAKDTKPFTQTQFSKHVYWHKFHCESCNVYFPLEIIITHNPLGNLIHIVRVKLHTEQVHWRLWNQSMVNEAIANRGFCAIFCVTINSNTWRDQIFVYHSTEAGKAPFFNHTYPYISMAYVYTAVRECMPSYSMTTQ